MTLLAVHNLCAGYGKVRALFDCSFAVSEGQFVALLGANGAGKTTTLRVLSGLLPGTGEILFKGQSLAGHSAASRVSRGIAQVPQGRGTFAPFSVDDNLELGALTVSSRQQRRRDKERWYEMFPRLAERRKQAAGTLSGGEQQMLALARALMSRPKLLMCDEPSLGLAPAITLEIFGIFSRLNREEGLTLLVVEQNADLTLRHADEAFLMEAGRIVSSGPASRMLEDEDIQRSYLGV